MSTINFSHLRSLAIFSTVVETASFAATARKLGSSRSRISELISALEADIGIRLLQRSTRQLKITDEGKKVYEQARQLPIILHSIDFINTSSTPKGRVDISMPHDIAHRFILPVLNDFQRKYPDIQLDLVLDDNTLNLIDEQIDIAIRVGIPKDESIIARVMHEERFKLFASPAYIENAGLIKTIKNIEKCHYILFLQDNQNRIVHLRQHNKMVSYYDCYPL